MPPLPRKAGIPLAAGLAFGEGAGAVDFHQHFLACAGGAMEAVDVLCDDQFHFTRLFEADDAFVNDVRLCIAVRFPHLEFAFPVLDACRLALHKILIIYRLARGPNAAFAAKGGDAARRGNARAGEDEDALRFAQPVGEFFGHEESLARSRRVVINRSLVSAR